jgi:adenosylhomocysteine nucleosidase
MPPAETGTVAIVTALAEELAPVRRRTEVRSRPRADGLRLFQGILGGRRVTLARTGDGPVAAFENAARLLRLARPSVLIGFGVAGAASPELGRGEVLVARRILGAASLSPAPDPAWLSRACSQGAREATLVTSKDLLVSARQKRELRDSLGEAGPVAVDRESASWGAAAMEAGVPFLALRAVSDTSEDELPGFLPACHGASGRVSRWRAAAFLAARPRDLGPLLRFRRRVADAAERAAAVLEATLLAGGGCGPRA